MNTPDNEPLRWWEHLAVWSILGLITLCLARGLWLVALSNYLRPWYRWDTVLHSAVTAAFGGFVFVGACHEIDDWWVRHKARRAEHDEHKECF